MAYPSGTHANVALAQSMLKEQFDNVVYTMTPKGVKVWELVQKETNASEARGKKYTIDYEPPQGGGTKWHMDSEEYGAPYNEDDVNASFTCKTVTTALSWTKDFLESAAGDKFSFGQGLKRKVKGGMLKHRRQINRSLYGDGYGALGQIGAIDYNITLALHTTITADATPTLQCPPDWRFVNQGDAIDADETKITVGDAAMRSHAGSVVAKRSNDLTKIYIAGDITDTWAVGDYIFNNGSKVHAGGAVTFREWYGLLAIINATMNVGLDPATYLWHAPKVFTAAADRPWTHDIMDRALASMGYNSDGEGPSHAIFALDHLPDIGEDLWSLYREPRGKKVKGGYGQDGFEWMYPGAAPVPLFFDDQALPGTVLLPNFNYIKKMIKWGPELLKDGNGEIGLRQARTLLYETAITTCAQFHPTERRKSALIEKISFTAMAA